MNISIFKTTMLSLLAVIILTAYVLIKQKAGPLDHTHSKSYHLKTDSISDLIDRVEWSLLRDNRVDYMTRYLMWGLWLTFLGSFLIRGNLPSASIFLRNWIIISLILMSLHGYYYWHSDKFSSFASLRALEALRETLGTNKGDVKSLDSYYRNKRCFGSDAPWTFTHFDYALGTRFP